MRSGLSERTCELTFPKATKATRYLIGSFLFVSRTNLGEVSDAFFADFGVFFDLRGGICL